RLASAPVAAVPGRRLERVCFRVGAPVRPRTPLRGGAACPRAADGGVRGADGQRLQALPPVLVRPGPGVLGGGEPRRAGPGPGRSRRHQQPRGDAEGGASRESLFLPGLEHRGGPGRHPPGSGAAARGRRGPVRGRGAAAARVAGRGGGAPPLPASLAEAVDLLDADAFYRKAFGDTLVSYLVMMKRFELGRYADALTEVPVPDGQDVSDWEMREYFEFF